MPSAFSDLLQRYRGRFHALVPFNPATDRLYLFDFTDQNRVLGPEDIADPDRLAAYISHTLQNHHARYGIGGYRELRILYARSRHFDTDSEPRRFHLGIDIWGPVGTPVMAPWDGVIHSFAFNRADGDYGATLILTHNLEGACFHTLYGHLSLRSLINLVEGKSITRGEVIGEFGMRFENGNWPPHLHFQLIRDMEGWQGDYPGVCKFSERDRWLENCPDPDLILDMARLATP